MVVTYPQHVKSVTLTSSCGDVNTLLSINSEDYIDTLPFNPVFNNEGECALYAYGEMVNNQITVRADTIILRVFTGVPTFSFSMTPSPFTTHTGKADTLHFAVISPRNSTVTYTLASDPDISMGEMSVLESTVNDSAHIYFDPQVAGVYTVTLTAYSDAITAAASVPVTVFTSLYPKENDNPTTLLTGTTDTLSYTLSAEQVAAGITMELIDAAQLPPDIATVIPGSTDSLLIAVHSAQEGSLSFSIATVKGELTDTSFYSISIINQSNAVWATASDTIDAIEGALKSVDLTQYLFEGITIGQITPIASVGIVNKDGAWSYTPSWGSDETVTVTITIKRNEIPQNFTLTLTVAPGDENGPGITLLSPEYESETVNTSEVNVSVVVEDSGAGVGTVTFTAAEKTVAGTLDSDNVWSALISGFPEDTATEVVITAVDKSMKKNSTSKKLTLTYDPNGGTPDCTPSTAPDSVMASKDTICYGEVVKFTIVGGQKGKGASWRWYTDKKCYVKAKGEFNSDSSSLSINAINSITCYVRAEGACGNTAARSVSVIVPLLSSNPFSISSDNPVVTKGFSSTLTLEGGTLGTGGVWKWYEGDTDGESIDTGRSISVTPQETTVYYLRAEGPCENTTFFSDTVYVTQGIAAVSASGCNYYILKEDGTPWVVGEPYGLGGLPIIGSDAGAVLIPTVIPNQSDVIRVFSIWHMNYLVKSDKSVWACGYNNGSLGDGTNTDRPNFVKLTTLSDIVQICTDGWSGVTMFLKNDGTLLSCGGDKTNHYYTGRIDNDGKTTEDLVPEPVLDNVVSIAMGDNYALAVKADGSVWVCGHDESGAMGTGSVADTSVTFSRIPNIDGVKKVATACNFDNYRELSYRLCR